MFIFRPERSFYLSRTSEPDNVAYNSRAAQAAGLRHVTKAERREPPDNTTPWITFNILASRIGRLAPPRCCAALLCALVPPRRGNISQPRATPWVKSAIGQVD